MSDMAEVQTVFTWNGWTVTRNRDTVIVRAPDELTTVFTRTEADIVGALMQTAARSPWGLSGKGVTTNE